MAHELTNEEQQIYVTIVLRYYNYYLSKELKPKNLNDAAIMSFSEWYNKFIYDADLRTVIKEHNLIKTNDEI